MKIITNNVALTWSLSAKLNQNFNFHIDDNKEYLHLYEIIDVSMFSSGTFNFETK